VTPSVSVIVPTRRRPLALARCLAALAQLDHPAERLEVIVADDGGTLGPFSPPEGQRVRILRMAWRGPAAARNAAAAVAEGDVVAFTDDDCEPDRGWLRELLPAISAGVAGGGHTTNRLPDNAYAATSQHVQDLVYAHFNCRPADARFIASNNLAVPRADFAAVGGFDGRRFRGAAEDRDFCDRWRASGGRLVYVPEAVVRHAHDLDLPGFWRQHFGYGRGAACFHAARAARGSGRLRDDMPFHFDPALWRATFELRPRRRAARTAALLMVWQVANATGFACERVRLGRDAV